MHIYQLLFDQTHGINDLRSFFINSRKQVNVYADNETSKLLKQSFSYCFKSFSKEYPATLKLNKLKKNSFIKHKSKNLKFKSIVVQPAPNPQSHPTFSPNQPQTAKPSMLPM